MRVRVAVKGLRPAEGQLGDLEATIWGEDLHAPLIERVVELPMDVTAGARAPCCPPGGVKPMWGAWQGLHTAITERAQSSSCAQTAPSGMSCRRDHISVRLKHGQYFAALHGSWFCVCHLPKGVLLLKGSRCIIFGMVPHAPSTA